MSVLIGLGKAGCEIVNGFSNSHKKITIDAGSELPEFNSPEHYEEKLTDYSHLLTFQEQECYFFVCGAGKVSAASLRLLELIQSKKINLIYIYPEEIMLSPIQRKLNRVAFNVFQQYARSGLLHSMYIVSNEQICSFLPYYSIDSMYSHINAAIINVFENIIFYLKEDPVLGAHHEPKQTSRIRTVEYGEFEKNKKNMYFPLDNITETCYINIVSDDDMKNNTELLGLLKNKIKEDNKNNIDSSFVVFKSEYEHSFYYAIRFTHYLQEK